MSMSGATTRRGDSYVTVIIDLTRIREGSGPARLLDMVEGRSTAAFKTWLAERPQDWRDGVEAVAMDGLTGFTTAAAEELPDAVAVMDPVTWCAWPVTSRIAVGAAFRTYFGGSLAATALVTVVLEIPSLLAIAAFATPQRPDV